MPKAVPPTGPIAPTINNSPTLPNVAPTVAPSATSGTPTTSAQQTVQNFVATPKQKKLPTANKPSQTPDNPPEKSGNDLIPGTNNEPTAADDIKDAVSSIHITAGLGIAFVVLMFLLWALVPTASGYTRLQLLWFTIIGQTKLSTDTSPSPTSQSPSTPSTPGPQGPLVTIPTQPTQPAQPGLPYFPPPPSAPIPFTPLTSNSGPNQNGHSAVLLPDLSSLNHYSDF